MKFQNITYSVPWNLFLITVGNLILSIGLKSIIIPHGMITGGFSGSESTNTARGSPGQIQKT